MGIEFFPCDFCSTSVCDAGDWWSCDVCGHRLCRTCADDQVAEDGDTGDEICPYCCRDLATDTELLEFALTKLGVTRDTLAEQYRNA